MNRYGQFTTFRTQPGKGDELINLLLRASAAMRALEHCQLYVVSKDRGKQDCVRVFEVWDSKAAHDDSLHDPRVTALISEALPLIAGRPESVELDVREGSA